ncbi:MAG: AAA family ATPase [Desulfocucumaceae bacterium]
MVVRFAMHLERITLCPEQYPASEDYPFNLEVFNVTRDIIFETPVTFFAGENGTGKSTLLKAIAYRCGIPIWKGADRPPYHTNRHSEDLCRYIEARWAGETVPGSYFAAEIFHNFAQILDEWARNDPGMLDYYGGESLITKSHGQCHMAYFKSRYRIKGLYLLDEPENALSPKRQIELLEVLGEMSRAGHAQFIIATHSPILLALPGSVIYSFDHIPVKRLEYEETDYYRIYNDFMNNRHKYIKG